MADSDWYADFVAQQSNKSLSPRECQEVRALLQLDASTRLFRRRVTLWLKHMSVAVGAAVVLTQIVGPLVKLIKWLGGVLP